MVDLKNGILDFDGIRICGEMRLEDLERSDRIDVYRTPRVVLADSDVNTLCISNVDFYLELSFYKERIQYVELTPQLKNLEAPRGPEAWYQRMKFDLCAEVLKEQLGAPSEGDGYAVKYAYDWGMITCQQILDGKGAYTGGNIRISYKGEKS